jgi:glycosyltransferase involved in cell wall biosynthesis
MMTSGKGGALDALRVPAGADHVKVNVDGITVVPIAAAFNSAPQGTAMSGTRRMLHFLHFASLAGKVGKRLEHPDVVFATHTPLTIGLAGMELARHFRVPFVFEVRDLWPQALINCGVLTNPLVIAWLRRMERRIYRAARELVALSPGMKDGIVETGVVDPERVTVIPNASDLELFRPDIDGTAARRRLGLGDRFAAVYFGAMGRANGLDYVVEAGRVLRDRGDDRVVFVLHGDGGMRAHLQQLVHQYRLRNVVFSDRVPEKRAVAEIVAGCDCCLTIYAGTKRETTWSPNKMFDALAAGRPVVINVGGWLGETVEGNGCGVVVDPERPESLADAVCALAADPARCREMGWRARALGEREFGRDRLADRLESVLLRAASDSRVDEREPGMAGSV